MNRPEHRTTFCPRHRYRAGLLAAVVCCVLPGCAALTNPVGEGVPVRLVPPQLMARSKMDEQTIPLTVLGQCQPEVYRLAPGDVLGVFIDGFLGDRNGPLPLQVGPQVRLPNQLRVMPASGYPVPVQEDGTIVLPGVDLLNVKGMSVLEAREAIRKAYQKLIRPENERITVTLMHQRSQQVVVLRQEAGVPAIDPTGAFGVSRRNNGQLVDLAGYENDVLHALTATGGLPGLDAYNAVIVFRGCFHDGDGRALLLRELEHGAGGPCIPQGMGCTAITRIPFRTPSGQPPPVRACDVVLRTGDVVFLEARDRDIFYTGGLLPPGVHVLPRDRDLDVVEAIAQVRGPLFNGAFGGSNLSGALLQAGIGNPSPSLVSVVRRAPDGRQLVITVDLRKALRDADERLLVRAGDVLILQETPGEAFSRWLTQTFFNFNLLWHPLRGEALNGVVDVAAPDRISGRLTPTDLNR